MKRHWDKALENIVSVKHAVFIVSSAFVFMKVIGETTWLEAVGLVVLGRGIDKGIDSFAGKKKADE